MEMGKRGFQLTWASKMSLRSQGFPGTQRDGRGSGRGLARGPNVAAAEPWQRHVAMMDCTARGASNVCHQVPDKEAAGLCLTRRDPVLLVRSTLMFRGAGWLSTTYLSSLVVLTSLFKLLSTPLFFPELHLVESLLGE